jgi:hypothetical protein
LPTAPACKPLPATNPKRETHRQNLNKHTPILFLTLMTLSCGPRSGINNHADSQAAGKTPNPEHVKYVQTVLTAGQSVFKTNCAACHCELTGSCESPESPRLINTFIHLPMDSLSYYESFIRNSKDVTTNQNALHEFGKTLSDSLIKTVIEYVWLISKPDFRN